MAEPTRSWFLVIDCAQPCCYSWYRSLIVSNSPPVALFAANLEFGNEVDKKFEFDFPVSCQHNPLTFEAVLLLSMQKRGQSLRHDVVPNHNKM